MQGSFVEIHGSFVDIQGSFISWHVSHDTPDSQSMNDMSQACHRVRVTYDSFADIQGSFAEIQGSFAATWDTSMNDMTHRSMGWLRFVGSFKLQVAFANEPYKRDDILQKRLIILRSLLIVASPYRWHDSQEYECMSWDTCDTGLFCG